MTMIGEHRQEQDDGQRSCPAVIEELEHLEEHPVGHNVGVKPPSGHNEDDVEDLQNRDGDRRRDGDDRALDDRDDDAEEDLALARAVEPGGLEDLDRRRP